MTDQIKEFIRVDHAGEYGAAQIYAGQLAVLGGTAHAAELRHMQAQEQAHLDRFSDLIHRRRVRPTALLPVWRVAGFALGAVTAALGPRTAMACTVAIEETIDAHYAAQETALGEDDPELKDTIARFRAEELAHRDIALANGAEKAPAYRLLTALIKTGCKAAIRISEKI
jgi:ubiquinone biosynthesis monooxygenase Coq7